MASLSTDGQGNRTIQFVAADGKRRSIRLDRMTRRQAEGGQLRVEALAAASRSRLPLDPETARWVGEVGVDLAAKLARVGLIPARSSETLEAFLAGYIAERRAGAKPTTLDNLQTPANALTAALGADTPLRAVTPAAAARFLAAQQTRLGRGTVARQLCTVRQFFRAAVARGLLPADPFAGPTAPGGLDRGRQRYVNVADAGRLLAAADPGWRTALALMRFAGLRCPTEVAGLRWADVHWETGRMTVSSPKTEHRPPGVPRGTPLRRPPAAPGRSVGAGRTGG